MYVVCKSFVFIFYQIYLTSTIPEYENYYGYKKSYILFKILNLLSFYNSQFEAIFKWGYCLKETAFLISGIHMLVQSPSLGHCRFALFTFIHFYQLRYSLIYFFIIISFVYLIFRNNILTGVSSFWCCNYNIALSSLTFLVFTSPFF